MECKKHVDYLLSTCADSIITSSEDSTFIAGMREYTSKVMQDVFEVAQSHEDHLAQYEEMGIPDDGRGKYHAWSKIPKPPKPKVLSKLTALSIGSSPVDSENDAEADESFVATQPQKQSSLAKPTRQSQTTLHGINMATPMGSVSCVTSPQLETHRSASLDTLHSTLSSRTSSQTPSTCDESMGTFGTPTEPHHNNEPDRQRFHEQTSTYNHTSYNAFELQRLNQLNQQLCAFPYQPQSQVNPIPATGSVFDGYTTQIAFQQSHPSTMSPASAIYSTQPSYNPLYVPDMSYTTYPTGIMQGYPSSMAPDSAMDSKATCPSASTSFGSVSSGMDMQPTVSHGLSSMPNVQKLCEGYPYCDGNSTYCMCHTCPCSHSR